MDFALPDQTRSIERNVRDWALAHAAWPRDNHVFARDRWREVVELGILSAEQNGGTILDTAAAFLAIGRAGMPGPLLESHLAAAAGYAVDGDEVVASVGAQPGAARGGGVLVGWGSVADVVVDAATGVVVQHGPLAGVELTYPLPHGWLEPWNAAPADGVLTRAWVIGAAAIAGLADAAVAQSVEHAKARHQFGRALGSFQAVQTRLVDSLLEVRKLRTAVLDAASQVADERPGATIAAAIAWVAAGRASRVVEANCHQVHGATGFALETGLVGLTWPMWWIRESIGRAAAVSFLRGRLNRVEHRPALVREFFTV
jgi:alkylation response protein AidB-like acyl-CoA dehydrogenase